MQLDNMNDTRSTERYGAFQALALKEGGKQCVMFPCHTDHHNAGCDNGDNSLPAMLCYSERSGALEKQDIPFVLLVLF